MDAIKERPILFSAQMVRALLNGSKTQTRRICKPMRGFNHYNILKHGMPYVADPWAAWWHGPDTDRVGCLQDCPYGKPGDRLWVRETVARRPASTFGIVATNGVESAYYRADDEDVVDQNDFNVCPWFDGPVCVSIHMPRWVSRITLEIVSVRIERLQEISEADAMAEGVDGPMCAELSAKSPWKDVCSPCAVHAYAALWESINGDGSWAANPFVWVVQFRVVPRERAA